MGRTFATAAAVLLLASTQAQAFCRDDLKDMEPRVERLKTSNKERYALVSHWYGLALEYEPVSEAQCRTFYLRAQKAFSDPLIQVQNCKGPNLYLPECNNGGVPPGGPAYLGAGGFPAGGGGGGGGGGPVGPIGGPPAPATFVPPNSPGSAGSSFH